jgi:hypothetical protein
MDVRTKTWMDEHCHATLKTSDHDINVVYVQLNSKKTTICLSLQ